MVKLLYLILISIFCHLLLVENGLLPNSAKWLVELSSLALVPVIFINIALKKQFLARPAYLFLLGSIFLVVVVSAIINQSSASALILGIRHHYKFLPFFFLPLAYDFDPEEVKKILLLLCGLCLIQLPVTVIQRFFQYSHLVTGDNVTGTVGGSGVVSVILVAAISVLYAYYITGKLTLKWLLTISFILFLPTTINETKVTFFILPISLMAISLIQGEKSLLRKLKRLSVYFLLTILFIGVFIQAYNIMYGGTSRGNLIEQFTWELKGRGYLYLGKERADERIEAGIPIGRVDTIVIAAKSISEDIGSLFFGLGAGSSLSTNISILKVEKRSFHKYFPDMTAIANILWELGLIGLLLHLTFLFLIFQDSLYVRQKSFFLNALGLGWCGVVVTMPLTMFYINILYTDPLNIVFWFVNGVIVSDRQKIERING